jgi:hypothetical protein
MLEIEDDRERRKQLEAYLDKGRGACHLRREECRPRCGRLAPPFSWQALRLALVGRDAQPRPRAVQSGHYAHVADCRRLESCTAREANRLLGRRGQF